MSDVPVLELPDQPSLEQLRKQAKDLRRAEGIGLSAAQLAVARRYGFASWTRLKRHVEFVTRYSRFPDRITADAGPGRGVPPPRLPGLRRRPARALGRGTAAA